MMEIMQFEIHCNASHFKLDNLSLNIPELIFQSCNIRLNVRSKILKSIKFQKVLRSHTHTTTLIKLASCT